jgi:quercetin dioxygenase-like cupin family protein
MEKILSSNYFIENNDLEWENVGKGVQRKILGYDEQIMLVVAKFEKDGIGYAHQHSHRQVTYVTEGKFEVQINGEKKILKKGDCYYIPPDITHGAVCLEDGLLVDVFNPCREDFLK